MGKEILYRRSFHCDRDLKNVKNMLELEKAFEGRKAHGDERILRDGGFEAPRNSLDIPAGGFMDRRHSEVRYEDIPMGYELSRCLTTRRRNEDPLVRKSTSSADCFFSRPKFLDMENPEADQKSRASSVVARLMGLDPLPHHENVQGLQTSKHPSSRRLLPNELFMPQSGDSTTDKHAGVAHASSQSGTAFNEESIPEQARNYGELSFRNHPQEKQLQEFKREFAAVNQRKQVEICPKMDMLDLHQKVFQTEKQNFGRETLQESQEFLDALEFLHKNKDFFVKVLKDPNSLLSKNIEHRGGVSLVQKDALGEKGRRLTRSFSESRKENYICLPVSHDSTDLRRKHEMNRYESDAKAQKMCISRFGQDEHVPSQSCPHSCSVSLPLRTEYDQTIPTKIVVLKPKLQQHGANRRFRVTSPISQLDASFKGRVDTTESARDDIPGRPMGRNRQTAAKEPCRNLSRDRSKDAGDIARQIVKQVKEDMSRRLVTENTGASKPTSLTRSSSRVRQSPAAEKFGMFADAPGESDGEVCRASSRKTMRNNGKANVGLPSSPRVSRIDSENECRPVHGNGRKGVPGEKSSRTPTSANNRRDVRKEHMGVGGFLDVVKKQDGIKDVKYLINSRTGGSKDGKSTIESPKVLPRSLSAPASAAIIDNRGFENEQNGRVPVDRSARLNNPRMEETSPFKERLLTLKDSFSLNKKSSSKKQTNSIPAGTSELFTPRQLTVEHEGIIGVDGKESCIHTLPDYSWQTTCSRQDDKGKAGADGCFDYLTASNSMESSDRQQWTSTGDLLDSASDVSLEKCEQPSPVSVLDVPFQEESPSPEQTSSECPETSLKFSPLDLDYKKCLLDLHEMPLSSSAASQQSSSNAIPEATRPECNCVNSPLDTLIRGAIACPLGSEGELVYIRDVFAFAGFTENELVTRAQAFSEEHGLDPSTFARLESHYEKMSRSKTSSRHIAASAPLNASRRRMLYDIVDEIVTMQLIEHTSQLGLKQAKPFVHNFCTGKQLLEQVWVHLNYYRYVPCDSEEDGLDNLASRELMKDPGWLHSPIDMQAVAMELERLICGDLIRQLVHDWCLSM